MMREDNKKLVINEAIILESDWKWKIDIKKAKHCIEVVKVKRFNQFNIEYKYKYKGKMKF